METVLVRYISEHWFIECLEASGILSFFDYELEQVPFESIGEDFPRQPQPEDCWCKDVSTCKHVGVRWGLNEVERITKCDTGGYDLITAISQEELNHHLLKIWEQAKTRLSQKDAKSAEVLESLSIASYSFNYGKSSEPYFRTTFKAPHIQLLDDFGVKKAILYINIEQGYVKPLGPNKSCFSTPLVQFKVSRIICSFDGHGISRSNLSQPISMSD